MPDGIGDSSLRVASATTAGQGFRFVGTGACGMDDEVQCRAVAWGEVAGLVAAYRRAVRGADQLRAELVVAGVDPEDLTVVAGLDDDGQPVVHVSALPVVAVRLAALIVDDSGSPPGLAPWYPCRGGPDVA
jgi:hypothetical protein